MSTYSCSVQSNTSIGHVMTDHTVFLQMKLLFHFWDEDQEKGHGCDYDDD